MLVYYVLNVERLSSSAKVFFVYHHSNFAIDSTFANAILIKQCCRLCLFLEVAEVKQRDFASSRMCNNVYNTFTCPINTPANYDYRFIKNIKSPGSWLLSMVFLLVGRTRAFKMLILEF